MTRNEYRELAAKFPGEGESCICYGTGKVPICGWCESGMLLHTCDDSYEIDCPGCKTPQEKQNTIKKDK
jgi:hypothetical protein